MIDHTKKKLWVGLALLVLLSPLGLIVPKKLNAGGAWGEWSAQEIKTLIGYVPEKMGQLQGLWKGLMPNYGIPGLEKNWQVHLAYVAAGLVGVLIILMLCFHFGKRLAMPEEQEKSNESS